MMKNKKVILFFVILAVGIILLLIFHKHKFSWKISFRTDDTEPYGCMVFDSIMSSSMKGNYQVLNINPDSLLCMKEHQGKTILCLFDYLDIDPQRILEYTKKGGHVILACHYCDYITGSEIGYDNYFLNVYNQPREQEFDTIEYHKDNKYNSKKYVVSKCIIQTVITPHEYDIDLEGKKKHNHDFKWKDVISTNVFGDKTPVMKTTDYGKGKITLLSIPLLLTNYGILE